jgi:SAM-dependent methyltransferase
MPLHFLSSAARRDHRATWQEVALAAGYLAGRHFLGTNDLHYGYWMDGLKPEPQNLACAQEYYSQFVLNHIPADARRILDVGCGGGSIALKLANRGHDVDCLSPSHSLNSQARQLLGSRARVFHCKYEQFEPVQPYDLIMFCESFQYIDMEQALARAFCQLNAGGNLLICDYFRKPTNEPCPIAGGHSLDEFQKIVARSAFLLVEEIDITHETAPTYTVTNDVFRNVLQPIWGDVETAAVKTHPIITRCLTTIFRAKISKIKRKYFSSHQSAANFEKFKTYRLMRFQRE